MSISDAGTGAPPSDSASAGGAPLPPPAAPPQGGGPQLLQTRDLLSDCGGAGAEWLAAASSGAGPAAGSAGAEFFQLTPLPEVPSWQETQPGAEQQAEQQAEQEAEQAQLQQRWQPAGWLGANAEEDEEADSGPELSDSSSLSIAAAVAAAAAANGADPERPGSSGSVMLSSPEAGKPMAYPPAATAGSRGPDAQAAGAATEPTGAASGGGRASAAKRRQGKQRGMQQLHINAAYEPGNEDAEAAGEAGSPAAQLARLLAFPLTPDHPPSGGAAEAGSTDGNAPASSVSGGGAGGARITPGGSPADAPAQPPAASQQQQQQEAAPGPAAGHSSSDACGPRSLGPQLHQQALQQQVFRLQQEARELRESLAVAESSAAAYLEQTQLLRGAAAAAEERQAAAQARQAQALSALQAAVREQQALQQQAEAAEAQRWEAEQRGAALREQLELLSLERSEAVAAAAASGSDGSLLSTVADLGAGNALMGEVALLRSQLEATTLAKRQLASALAQQREQAAALRARLAAAAASHEQQAAAHAQQLNDVSTAAADRCAALQAQWQHAEVQAAALAQQLVGQQTSAASAAALAVQQADAAAAAAEQAQAVVVADLRRQLHAEREARREAQALADAAAAQVTQQAAAFSEALLQQQREAARWRGQAEELSRQLAVSDGAEADIKAALQVGWVGWSMNCWYASQRRATFACILGCSVAFPLILRAHAYPLWAMMWREHALPCIAHPHPPCLTRPTIHPHRRRAPSWWRSSSCATSSRRSWLSCGPNTRSCLPSWSRHRQHAGQLQRE